MSKTRNKSAWVHKGFEEFLRGSFDNGGDNLYVNANGVIEMVHRYGVNKEGHVDIVLPNSHGYIERGPTWIYTQPDGEDKDWPRRELPNDSGWMSRAMDVDGDGHNDLIVVNGENGVTSELDSYIYWGGPNGLVGERTELPTAGAYDMAAVDLTGNGLVDIIFPSAWVDHHNAGRPRLVHVYEQVEPRKFVEASEHHGIIGIAACSIACEDLNSDGRPELVVANYREEFEYDTSSFVYWGIEGGFDASAPLRLPSHYAMQVILGDLNGDGYKEIVFAGGNKVYVYWNDRGSFSPHNLTILDAEANSTSFCMGAVRAEIADVDGDGRNELLLAMRDGVEIRAQDNLHAVKILLPAKHCGWVEAVDLDGDGRLDLVTCTYEDGYFYESQSALFWNGPQGFSFERATWLDTTGAMGCTAGDLDGDGRPEIIFNNTMRGWSQFNPQLPLYIYLGNEKNEYCPGRRLELPTGGGTNTYVIADLDLDGYADLAMTSSGGLRIFPGGPDGLKPDKYCDLPNRGHPFQYVAVADLNHDGWLDLIGGACTYDAKPETMAHSSVIYRGGRDGYSLDRSTVLPTYSSGAVLVADVNHDGWLDIIYSDARRFLGIYLGGPNGFSTERMWWIPLDRTDIGKPIWANGADLNGDGWLDLVVAVMGHYTREQSGFFLLYGGPDGFSSDRIEFHPTQASSVRISLADMNNDGNLDLLVPAYSTQVTRELPAHIFWGNGKSFDWEHPFVIPCDASCAFMAIDITGNGYLDLLTVCHRNDLGHQVPSLLFWNGPEGLFLDRVTPLPGLGPHLACPRDFGNMRTREPLEAYVSPAYDMRGLRPTKLSWKAEVPAKTQLKFQLRWANTAQRLASACWSGPSGEGSYYEKPGSEILGVDSRALWLQYKAIFISLNGCLSPQLTEVRVEMDR